MQLTTQDTDKTQEKCGEGSEWHIGAAFPGVAPRGARPGLGGSVRAPRPPDPPRGPLPCRRLADHRPLRGGRPKRVAGAFSDVKRPDQGPAHHGNAVNVCDYRHVNVRSGVLVM